MKYYLYIENRLIAEIEEDTNSAYSIYHKTSELAEMLGEIAHLVDGETGEILESSDDWDDYDEDYEPDLEMGFDPYEGCYTYDC